MAGHRTTVPICPGVLNLHTNAKSIPDFQLGRFRFTDGGSVSSEVSVTYDVGAVDSVLDRNKGIELRDGVITYQKSVGAFGELKCEIAIGQADSSVTVNRTYHRLGRTSIGTVPSVGKLLEDVVSVTLLQNGYMILYCGGVSHDGNVTVMIGLTNSGKTTAVLNLLKRESVEYVAEDIAITDGSELYCCPYAVSPIDTDLLDSPANPIATWLSANVPLLDSVTVRSIESIYDVLDEDRVTLSGEISRICFLSRSGIWRESDPSQRIMLANRSEFSYVTNPILLGAQFHGSDVDVEAAAETERNIVQAMVDGSQTHYVSGGFEATYEELRRQILHDSTA